MSAALQELVRTFDSEAVLGPELKAGENQVFRVQGSTRDFILRVTIGKDRTREDLRAELDFLAYLVAQGFSAMPAVARPDGADIVEVGEGYASLFEVAPGGHAEAFGPHWDERLFREWGNMIGRLHSLSAAYRPRVQRFAFEDDPKIKWMTENFEGADAESLEVAHLRVRPVAERSRLLVHGDLGRTNFHLHEGKLWVFDFDDCVRHAPLYDIVVALWPLRNQPFEDRNRFLSWMLRGYGEQRAYDLGDLVPLFEWRSLYMLGHYLRKWGEAPTDEQRAWLEGARRQIAEPVRWF